MDKLNINAGSQTQNSLLETSAQVPTNSMLRSGVLTINGVGDFDASKFSDYVLGNSSSLVNNMKIDPKLAPYLKRKLEALASSISANGGIISKDSLNTVLPEAITTADGYTDDDITKYATNLLIDLALKFSKSSGAAYISPELALEISSSLGVTQTKKSFVDWFGKPSTDLKSEFQRHAAANNTPNATTFYLTFGTPAQRNKAMADIFSRIKSSINNSDYMGLVHYSAPNNYSIELTTKWLDETITKLLEDGSYASKEDVEKFVQDARLNLGINLNPWLLSPLKSEIAAVKAESEEAVRKSNTVDDTKLKRVIKPGTEEAAKFISPGENSWAEVTMLDGSKRYALIDLSGKVVSDLYTYDTILLSNNLDAGGDDSSANANDPTTALEGEVDVTPSSTEITRKLSPETIDFAKYLREIGLAGETTKLYQDPSKSHLRLSDFSGTLPVFDRNSYAYSRAANYGSLKDSVIFTDGDKVYNIPAKEFTYDFYKNLNNVNYIYIPEYKHLELSLSILKEPVVHPEYLDKYDMRAFTSDGLSMLGWDSGKGFVVPSVWNSTVATPSGDYLAAEWDSNFLNWLFGENWEQLDWATGIQEIDSKVRARIGELTSKYGWSKSYDNVTGQMTFVIGSEAGYHNLTPVNKNAFKVAFRVKPGMNLDLNGKAGRPGQTGPGLENFKRQSGGKLTKSNGRWDLSKDTRFDDRTTTAQKVSRTATDLVVDDADKLFYNDANNKTTINTQSTRRETDNTFSDVLDIAAVGASFIPGIGMAASAVLGGVSGLVRSIREMNSRKAAGEEVTTADWGKSLLKNVGIGLVMSNVVGRGIKVAKAAKAAGSTIGKFAAPALQIGVGGYLLTGLPGAISLGVQSSKALLSGQSTDAKDVVHDISTVITSLAAVSPMGFANRASNRMQSKNAVEALVGVRNSGKVTDPNFMSKAPGKEKLNPITGVLRFILGYAELGDKFHERRHKFGYKDDPSRRLLMQRAVNDVEFIPLNSKNLNQGIKARDRVNSLGRGILQSVELSTGIDRQNTTGKIPVYYSLTKNGQYKFFLPNTEVGNAAFSNKKLHELNLSNFMNRLFTQKTGNEAPLVRKVTKSRVKPTNAATVTRKSGGRINNILKLNKGGKAGTPPVGGSTTLWNLSTGKITGESIADKKRRDVYQSGSTTTLANLGLNTANTSESVLQYRRDNFVNNSGDIFWNNIISNLEKHALDKDTKEVIKEKIIEYANSYNTLQDNFNFIQKNFVDENGNMKYGTFDGDTPDNEKASLIYKYQQDFNTLFGDADKTLREKTYTNLSKSGFPHGEKSTNADGTTPGYDIMFGLATANRYGDVDADKLANGYNEELKKYGVLLINLNDPEVAAKFPQFNADGGAKHRLVGVDEDGNLYPLSTEPVKSTEDVGSTPSDANPIPNNSQNPGNVEGKTILGLPMKEAAEKLWISRKLPLDIASTFMAFHQPNVEEYAATSLQPYRLKSHLMDNNPLLKHFLSQAATTLTSSLKPVTSDASLQAGMAYQGNVEANKLKTLGLMATKEYYDKSMQLIKATEDNNVATANLIANQNLVSQVEADNTNRLVRNLKVLARYQNIMNWLRQRVVEENAYDIDRANFQADAYNRYAANLNNLDISDFDAKYRNMAVDYASLDSNRNELNSLITTLRQNPQSQGLVDPSGNLNTQALDSYIKLNVRYTDATKSKFDTLDKTEEAYWSSLIKAKNLQESIDRGTKYKTLREDLNTRMTLRQFDSFNNYGQNINRVKHGWGFSTPNFLTGSY